MSHWWRRSVVTVVPKPSRSCVADEPSQGLTLRYFVSPSCGLRLLVLYSTLVGFVTLYSGLPSCKKNITYKMGQFRYFKIQLQTMDVNMRLWCINPTNTAVYSPESRAGVYCLQVSLNHRNWPIDLSWF